MSLAEGVERAQRTYAAETLRQLAGTFDLHAQRAGDVEVSLTYQDAARLARDLADTEEAPLMGSPGRRSVRNLTHPDATA